MEPPQPPRLTAEEEQALLDELGDVFLTNSRPAAPTAVRPASATRPGDGPRASHERPPDDDPDEADPHPLEGPAPIRLRPKVEPRRDDPGHTQPQATNQAATAVAADDPTPETPATEPSPASHATARMVPDRGTPVEPRRAASPSTALAELVLMGNLPGMSGPWLTQYAQLIAEEEGPVALVHVDDEAIEVELVEPADATLTGAATTTRMIAGSDGRLDAVGVLAALLERDDDPVRNVLLHGESTEDAETVVGYADLPTWTMLTGGDDAALVAGYAMLKRLAAVDPAPQGREVGVMVMGSDASTASTAAERLQRAAGGGLAYHVEVMGHRQRMAPVRVRPLCRFTATPDARAALLDWLGELEPPEAPAPAQRHAHAIDADTGTAPPAMPVDLQWPRPRGVSNAEAAAPAPPSAPPPRPATEMPPREPVHAAEPPPSEPARFDRGETESAGAAAPAAPAPQQAPPPPEPDRVAPPPEPPRAEAPRAAAAPAAEPAFEEPTSAEAVDAAAMDDQKDTLPSLAGLLLRDGAPLAGGVALEARCPDHPDAELVLDDAGTLHVLARHDSESDAGSPGDPQAGPPDLDAVLLRLMRTRRWAQHHRELLALTRRQLRFDDDAAPRLHLFTDRPDLATRLVADLAGEVTLHLLQEVQLGDESGWYCTPLG